MYVTVIWEVATVPDSVPGLGSRIELWATFATPSVDKDVKTMVESLKLLSTFKKETTHFQKIVG